MALSTSSSIFLISLLAIPITYMVNTASAFHGEAALFFTGVGALSLVCGLVYFAVRNKGHPTDPLLYGMSSIKIKYV